MSDIELADGTLIQDPVERFLVDEMYPPPGREKGVNDPSFVEHDHPRGPHGEWIDKPDILEEGFNYQTWFHVTLKSSLPKILDHGLLPQEQGTATRTRFNIDPTAVYLFPTIKAAKGWIEYRQRRFGDEGEQRILKVYGIDARKIAPDPEPFSEILRWRLHPADWKPNENVSGGKAEAYLFEALDKVGYYRDAVGGPEFVTLRQWLNEQPDQDKWSWVADSPTSSAPDWYDPEAPWKQSMEVLHRMPVDLRWRLAAYTSENPGGIFNSIVYYGTLPPEAITDVTPIHDLIARFETGGDAVGKEYHGYVVARDAEGRKLGYLDYAYLDGEAAIQMIHVEPDFRRRGVATAMLQYLRGKDGPLGEDVQVTRFGDVATEEGRAWMRAAGIKEFRYVDEHPFLEHEHPRGFGGRFRDKPDVADFTQMRNVLPSLPWEDPPAAHGEGIRPGGFSASGKTNTEIGDLAEMLIRKIGPMRSLLPEGKRQNPLDAAWDHSGWGFEVKAFTTDAKRYKIGMKTEEVDSKRKYAEDNGLRPAMMMVILDLHNREAHVYWRDGIGNYRLNKQGWNYMGSVHA